MVKLSVWLTDFMIDRLPKRINWWSDCLSHWMTYDWPFTWENKFVVGLSVWPTEFMTDRTTVCLTDWLYDYQLIGGLTVWLSNWLLNYMRDCVSPCLTIWGTVCLTAWLCEELSVRLSDNMRDRLSNSLTIWGTVCLTVFTCRWGRHSCPVCQVDWIHTCLWTLNSPGWMLQLAPIHSEKF